MRQHLRRMMIGWGLVAALALTACLPQGVRVPQSQFLAALERKAGLIAYVGNDNDIYVIDQGGGKKQALTKDATAFDAQNYQVYGLPIWTNDSQQVAFAGYHGLANQAPSENDLYVASKDGAHLSKVYSSPDNLIYYSWAPSGQQVSVLSATAGQALALKLVPAAGGDALTLDTGSPLYWAWAPDSQSVLVHANGQGGRLAYLQLGASVAEHQLKADGALATPTAFKAPAFSPDGQHVLFAGSTPQGALALYQVNRAGGDLKKLTEYPNDIAFTWSPDGKRVAYISSQQLRGPLTVLDPAGQAAPLTVAEDVVAFFWSPDSQSLAYFTITLVQPTAAPGPTTAASATEQAQPQVLWQLKIMDARSGKTRQIARLQPTDRFLQLLPYFDQYHQALTIWSPDSQNLVVSALSADGTTGIFVVAASGSLQPRFLAAGQVGVWSWK